MYVIFLTYFNQTYYRGFYVIFMSVSMFVPIVTLPMAMLFACTQHAIMTAPESFPSNYCLLTSALCMNCCSEAYFGLPLHAHTERDYEQRSLIRLLNLAISVAKSKEKFFGTPDWAAPLGVGVNIELARAKILFSIYYLFIFLYLNNYVIFTSLFIECIIVPKYDIK